MTRANNSVIALVTSGLVASCFYGNATLLPSDESGGKGGNLTQGGQAGQSTAGNGGVLNTAGTSNPRTAGAGGQTSTTVPSAGRAGSAGGGGQNRAGAGGLATNGGGGAGGRNSTAPGNAGNAGHGLELPSCRGLEPCNGESCCTTVGVPGGVHRRGSTPGAKECAEAGTCDPSESPENEIQISAFRLDKYEVTVGRFSKFLSAYDPTKLPKAGDGTNTSVGTRVNLTGWNGAWNAKLLAKNKLVERLTDSTCSKPTWPVSGEIDDTNRRFPINCIDWYTAFAFCIWDGARLPTEAEWEYAAAGGSEDRPYPWGTTYPNVTLASYLLVGSPSTPGQNVGSKPDGRGRWQHLDLAGSVFEWTLDNYDARWYANSESLVPNPINLGGGTEAARSARGGSALDGVTSLRAAARHPSAMPESTSAQFGVRCARNGLTN